MRKWLTMQKLCFLATLLWKCKGDKKISTSDRATHRNAIGWHRFPSTPTRVMASCLTAPSHYLKQCRLIFREVLCHSPQGIFTGNTQNVIFISILKLLLEGYSRNPRRQCVKHFTRSCVTAKWYWGLIYFRIITLYLNKFKCCLQLCSHLKKGV